MRDKEIMQEKESFYQQNSKMDMKLFKIVMFDVVFKAIHLV